MGQLSRHRSQALAVALFVVVATALAAMLPPLVVFILAQRQVIAGLTTEGTEG